MTKSNKIGDSEIKMDRRFKARRDEVKSTETLIADPVAEESPTRRKKQRRRQIDPTTCEREYNDDEINFMHAMDAYKRSSGRMFPTCSEILEVIRGMGYVKLTEEEQVILSAHRAECAPVNAELIES